MKKRKRIWIGIVFIIVIFLGIVVIKHWNSLTAVIDSFRYSQDEVVEKLNENTQQLQKYIDENENITVRDLTEEEAKMLNEGVITEEEAIAILTGKASSVQPSDEADASDASSAEEPAGETKKPQPSSKPQTPEATKESSDTVVSEAIAKLYIQKSKYLSKLDTIEANIRQAYIDEAASKSDEEKRAIKQRFINSNLSEVAAWEKECDGVVYGILDEIKTALKNAGQDTSVVKKLEDAYLNEKRLKKSYFINRYMD